MANNRVQVKRTSVGGRTPNTTNAGNLQYIAAGEFALNMTDQLLFTSDGTNLIYVGANQANQRISNSFTIDNNKAVRFTTVNTSATAYFIQQNDDNFVFYSTNTVYGARPIWSIYANSTTSNLQIQVPIQVNGVVANNTLGTSGQVLTSTGTSTYWAPQSAASVNVDAQYTWTNTQTFQNTITFSSNVAVGANVIVNTTTIFIGNSTVNSTKTSSLVQVSNSTSTANLTALDLKIGATTVVNATQVTATLHVGNVSGSYANITGQVNTATLYAATSANVAAAMLANSTGLYPSTNSILLGNTTARWVINANTINGTGDWTTTGNVGVGIAASATYRLQVNGSFAATTKSFVIDHPTKQDMKLRYGSLEGPENGVYVRGRANTNKIELPDYWVNLIDENTITVNLTPIGKKQELYVKDVSISKVTVGGSRSLDYYYTVFAERKDVEKLVVEF